MIAVFIFEVVILSFLELLYRHGIISSDLMSRYAYWISKKYL